MRAFEQRKKNTSTNSSFFSPKIQKKLKTGTPGDQFEVEADKVADKVVNNNSSGGLLQSKSEEEVQQKPISETISSVQGKEMKEEEPVQKKSDEKEEKVQKKDEKEEPVQKKAEEKEEPIQKKEDKKEEEPVQKKTEEKEEAVQKKAEEKEEPVQKKEEKKEEETVQKKTEEKEEVAQAKCAECEKEEKGQKKSNPSMVETKLKKGKGNPLDKKIKIEMENSFGVDFSSIRIHTDSNAINMCQEMKAQAFTNGIDIYFNKGKYNPDSSEGKKLLAHELTHTVQQGAVKQKTKKEK